MIVKIKFISQYLDFEHSVVKCHEEKRTQHFSKCRHHWHQGSEAALKTKLYFRLHFEGPKQKLPVAAPVMIDRAIPAHPG